MEPLINIIERRVRNWSFMASFQDRAYALKFAAKLFVDRSGVKVVKYPDRGYAVFTWVATQNIEEGGTI